MNRPILCVCVNSDNFCNQLFTIDAYAELRLQMSTGDFHTHTHELVNRPDLTDVITLEQIEQEQADAEHYEMWCKRRDAEEYFKNEVENE